MRPLVDCLFVRLETYSSTNFHVPSNYESTAGFLTVVRFLLLHWSILLLPMWWGVVKYIAYSWHNDWVWVSRLGAVPLCVIKVLGLDGLPGTCRYTRVTWQRTHTTYDYFHYKINGLSGFSRCVLIWMYADFSKEHTASIIKAKVGEAEKWAVYIGWKER
jgi:hypothetical protein